VSRSKRTSLTVSPAVLKAAKLFICGDIRPDFARPWAFRSRRDNIVLATDGYTMFVIRDPGGVGFTSKPVQIDGDPRIAMPAGWKKIVADIPEKRRAQHSVLINPKYHARVVRAARILDVTMVAMSVSTATDGDPILYTLGPDAWACVMPMHDFERPTVPEWLRKVVAR
jgi:hypothetical protein